MIVFPLRENAWALAAAKPEALANSSYVNEQRAIFLYIDIQDDRPRVWASWSGPSKHRTRRPYTRVRIPQLPIHTVAFLAEHGSCHMALCTRLH